MNATAAPATAPLLELRGIRKEFPGVLALDGVSLDLNEGEVLALLGENGAGKSTLIKTIGGAHRPDQGEIRIRGQRVDIADPAQSARAGIAIIYQEFNLIPHLSVRENLFLGRERARLGWVDRRAERHMTEQLFARLGALIDPDTPCYRLSVAQQQLVEIAKALLLDARVLVMDEPTAPLTPQEVGALFTLMRELRSQGIGIVFISHRLDEIYEIADRVTVLRDGRNVSTHRTGEVSREQLIAEMVGRSLDAEYPTRSVPIGAPLLEVAGLSDGERIRDVSFNIRRGEVVALTGLVGSGRTETARLIFGADRRSAGTIRLNGRQLDIRQPRDAIAAGICLLTEDRKQQGLILGQSVLENFGLPNLRRFSRAGVIGRGGERQAFNRYVEQLRIKIPHVRQLAKNLSGGNQQKVVLAKWLEANSEVLLFDEPTRGIDVGAKYEIYLLMNQLAAQGKGILMISSELPEVLGMADRILVMHEGRIAGEITDARQATQQQIMKLAVQ
ncbi:MAG: sugar ABC transporter ATP-binding protein [Planctomycetes bacterium]|nr:sugar ABC transporter ATP-binding protein [Planctomycetota bacterium]